MCATMEKLRICESGVMLRVLAGFVGWSMVGLTLGYWNSVLDHFGTKACGRAPPAP
jgi:hypothetical protein